MLSEGANHFRMVFHPPGARRWIVNWSEVARHLFSRARRELAHFPDDAPAVALLSELQGYLENSATTENPAARLASADLLLPIHIRKDELDMRLFSTIMTLGTPQDVTLQELRIETLFPADEPSKRPSES